MASSRNGVNMDKVCTTCGDIGLVRELATCATCKLSEHIYCMKKQKKVVPLKWACEDCGHSPYYQTPGKKRGAILIDFKDALNYVPPVKRTCVTYRRGARDLNGSSSNPRLGGDSLPPANRANNRPSPVNQRTREIAVPSSSKVPERHNQGMKRGPIEGRRASNGLHIKELKEKIASQRRYDNRLTDTTAVRSSPAAARRSSPRAEMRKETARPSGDINLETRITRSNAQAIVIAENPFPANLLGKKNCSENRLGDNGTSNFNILGRLLFVSEKDYGHHPRPNASWMGDLKVMDPMGIPDVEGIQAHIPGTVFTKVLETVEHLTGKNLGVKLHDCTNIWPKPFQLAPPTYDDIGLYFFPSKEKRLKDAFTHFVNIIDKKGLALQSCLGNVELLIFTSTLLPQKNAGVSQDAFLWGVFRHVRIKEQIPPGQHKNRLQITGYRCSSQDRPVSTRSADRLTPNAGLSVSPGSVQRERPAAGLDVPPLNYQAPRKKQAVGSSREYSGPHFPKPICPPKK